MYLLIWIDNLEVKLGMKINGDKMKLNGLIRKKRNHKTLWSMVGVVAIGVIAASFLPLMNDLRRYLRIRNM
jgi:hypothetical protein